MAMKLNGDYMMAVGRKLPPSEVIVLKGELTFCSEWAQRVKPSDNLIITEA
jgi:hypothetical protein